MTDITEFGNEEIRVIPGQISLCGHLAGFGGRYFLSGVSVPGEEVETLYYDPKADEINCVDCSPENIVAYFVADERASFVKTCMSEKIIHDTEGYQISFIAVDSFKEESLCVDIKKKLPSYLADIVWINDDFLKDESIPFDFEAFERIDTGVRYINPAHFSVEELVEAIRYYGKR